MTSTPVSGEGREDDRLLVRALEQALVRNGMHWSGECPQAAGAALAILNRMISRVREMREAGDGFGVWMTAGSRDERHDRRDC